MQHADDASLFNEPIIKRLKLKPFSKAHMDLEDQYILGLEEKIENEGYDPQQPIVVCESDIKEADGYIADGRHRLVCASRIEKRLKKPVDVTATYVHVDSMDEALILNIKYEAEHLIKKSRLQAQERIFALYEQVKILRYGKQFKILDFFTPEEQEKHKALVMTLQRTIQKYEKDKDRDERINSLDDWGTKKDTTGPVVEIKERSFSAEADVTCPHCDKKSRKAFNGILKDNGAVQLVEIL